VGPVPPIKGKHKAFRSEITGRKRKELAKLLLSKYKNIDLNADVPILQVVISKKRRRRHLYRVF
jgi:hypothetical protein